MEEALVTAGGGAEGRLWTFRIYIQYKKELKRKRSEYKVFKGKRSEYKYKRNWMKKRLRTMRSRILYKR